MRAIPALLLLLLLFPATAGAQTSLQCANLSFDLSLETTDKTTNGEVSKLQRFLTQFPELYPEKKVNGFYGLATQLAVQRFQTRYGIAPPSIADGWGSVKQATRERMANCAALLQPPVRTSVEKPSAPPAPAPKAPVAPKPPAPPTPSEYQPSYTDCPALTRDLARGASGQGVADLQFFLRDRGDFSGDVTGYFGPLTEAAVQSFQRELDIVSSGAPSTTGYGAVGPRTRTALERCAEDEAVEEELEEVPEEELVEEELLDEYSDEFEEELEESEEEYEEEYEDEELDTYPSCETSVEPETITAGDEATLRWTTTNATSAAWIGIGKVDLSGSIVVRPNEPAEYVLRIVGIGGEVEECAQYVDVVDIDAQVLTITAEPNSIARGGSSTITWSSENAAFCTLRGGTIAIDALDGSVSTGPLTSHTRFTLTCKSAAGQSSRSVIVRIGTEAFAPLDAVSAHFASALSAYMAWFEALLALLPE